MTWQEKAQHLLGEGYISTLAYMAGCNRRTMQRWVKGVNEVPKNIIDDVNATYEIWIK